MFWAEGRFLVNKMAMHYLMARDFQKAKTPVERMEVFLKYGFTEDRLIMEIRERNQGVARADYDDPESVHLCLEMEESGLRVLRGNLESEPITILEDERFRFYASIEASRREELRRDPVVRFNRLIGDYLALTVNPFGA